jgi:unsaturated rhamnogalacturonyl hydrolase
MKKFCLLLLIFFLGVFSTSSFAQKLPKKKQTRAAMTLANDYFMSKWTDTGKPIVTNKTRPSNIWTRAVYYEGLMALYAVDAQKRYYDYASKLKNTFKRYIFLTHRKV